MKVDDPTLVSLVSLAAQKFISDLAVDALTHNKMKQSLCATKKTRKDRKFVLTLEDLLCSLNDKGITVKKQPYFEINYNDDN